MPIDVPERIVAILTSASSPVPDPTLPAVLDAFRLQWRALASRKYPGLHADVEDAIQNALVKLVSPRKLAALADPRRVDAWARTIFVNGLLDILRDRRRDLGRGSGIGFDDDPDAFLSELASGTPTPEELVAQRQRMAIVARCIDGLPVATLKFVEGLPDKEIARRRGLTRDAVAGQLKRFRKALRTALEGPEGSGR